MASDFYAFLQNIYTVFGDELAVKKLYLSGESYAGMYIPSIARGIHRRNKKVLSKEKGYRSKSLKVINIRGAAIGNGWIDPHIQGPTVIDYAWWHGMIDLNTYRGLHAKWDQCIADQILDSSEEPFHPFNMPDECGLNEATMIASGGAFQYDVTTYDAYPAVLNEGANTCMVLDKSNILFLTIDVCVIFFDRRDYLYLSKRPRSPRKSQCTIHSRSPILAGVCSREWQTKTPREPPTKGPYFA